MPSPPELFSEAQSARRGAWAASLLRSHRERRVTREDLTLATDECLFGLSRGRLRDEPERLLSPRFQQETIKHQFHKLRSDRRRTRQLANPSEVVDPRSQDDAPTTKRAALLARDLGDLEQLIAALLPAATAGQLAVFRLRMAGRKWREIEAELGVDREAARRRFHRLLGRLLAAAAAERGE